MSYYYQIFICPHPMKILGATVCAIALLHDSAPTTYSNTPLSLDYLKESFIDLSNL